MTFGIILSSNLRLQYQCLSRIYDYLILELEDYPITLSGTWTTDHVGERIWITAAWGECYYGFTIFFENRLYDQKLCFAINEVFPDPETHMIPFQGEAVRLWTSSVDGLPNTCEVQETLAVLCLVNLIKRRYTTTVQRSSYEWIQEGF